MIAYEQQPRPVGRRASDIPTLSLSDNDGASPRMGSVSLSPHQLSVVPEAISENNLQAETAQGVPYSLPLVLRDRLSSLNSEFQYSWLPDVFRVKDSVSSPFSHVCIRPTLSRSSHVLRVLSSPLRSGQFLSVTCGRKA